MLFAIPIALAFFWQLTYVVVRRVFWPNIMTLPPPIHVVRTIAAPSRRWEPAIFDNCMNVFSPDFLFANGLTSTEETTDFDTINTLYNHFMEADPGVLTCVVLLSCILFSTILAVMIYGCCARKPREAHQVSEVDLYVRSLMQDNYIQLPITMTTESTTVHKSLNSERVRAMLQASMWRYVASGRQKAIEKLTKTIDGNYYSAQLCLATLESQTTAKIVKLNSSVAELGSERITLQEQNYIHRRQKHELEQKVQDLEQSFQNEFLQQQTSFDLLVENVAAENSKLQKDVNLKNVVIIDLEKNIEELNRSRPKLETTRVQESVDMLAMRAAADESKLLQKKVDAGIADNLALQRKITTLEAAASITHTIRDSMISEQHIENLTTEKKNLTLQLSSAYYKHYQLEKTIERLEDDIKMLKQSQQLAQTGSFDETAEALATASSDIPATAEAQEEPKSAAQAAPAKEPNPCKESAAYTPSTITTSGETPEPHLGAAVLANLKAERDRDSVDNTGGQVVAPNKAAIDVRLHGGSTANPFSRSAKTAGVATGSKQGVAASKWASIPGNTPYTSSFSRAQKKPSDITSNTSVVSIKDNSKSHPSSSTVAIRFLPQTSTTRSHFALTASTLNTTEFPTQGKSIPRSPSTSAPPSNPLRPPNQLLESRWANTGSSDTQKRHSRSGRN